MPKAFLVRKKVLAGNWCPVTPPPSPDEIVPENLSLKSATKVMNCPDHHHQQQQQNNSGYNNNNSSSNNNNYNSHNNRNQSKPSSPLARPPSVASSISSIQEHVLNLKNTHHIQAAVTAAAINHCFEPCAVDLSMSSKTDTTSLASSYSPHYASSSLSSPVSYSTSESDFDLKGKPFVCVLSKERVLSAFLS